MYYRDFNRKKSFIILNLKSILVRIPGDTNGQYGIWQINDQNFKSNYIKQTKQGFCCQNIL